MFGAAPLLICTGVALAQDPEPAGASDVPADAPAPPPSRLAVPYAERFVWEQRGTFPRRGAITSVAVQAGGEQAWLAVDEQGFVWRSEDRGATWSNVLLAMGATLGEEPDDEEILLDAEQARDEEIESAGADADPESREAKEEAESATQEATESVTERLAEDRARRGDAQAAPPIVWFHPLAPHVALTGRGEGIWRSTDGGLTFTPVDDSPRVLAFFADDASGLVLAGTSEGVRWSADFGETWIDPFDDTDGVAVRQLAREAGTFYAATGGGLFRARDGVHWERVDALDMTPIVAVVPDPDWEGGLWVATRTGLLRSDDDGLTFYSSGRQPLTDLRRLVPAGGPGHLLAASGDGVWETLDGGVRWVPAVRLLSDPDVRDLTFDSGIPVIATATAVWRMVAPVAIGEARGTRDKVLPLGAAVALAQHRAGLDVDLLSLSNRSLAAALAPRLELTFDWGRVDRRTADFRALDNDEVHDEAWALKAKLCWGACGLTIVTTDDGETLEVSADSFEDLAEVEAEVDIYVVDGEVYDEGQVVSAAANVAQSIRTYRVSLADQVSDAWLSRQRLASEAGTVERLPLREQVLHALKIAELDARLDAYTDGAFTRALVRTEEIR